MKLYNEKKVLSLFFKKPGTTLHIRQIARLTGIHPNTVMTLTDKLAKEGMILKNKSKETNIMIIKANNQNPQFILKKREYNINKIFDSGLVSFLEKKLAYPAIILFGSYAKGENHEKSDIDIFVMTEEKKKPDLKRYEKILCAEIQLFQHVKTEVKNLTKKNPELMNNVINGTKLSGFLEVF